MEKKVFDFSFTKSVALLAGLFLLSCSMLGQEPQQEQDVCIREIWDSNLLSKRPAGKAKPLPTTHDDGFVGITLWRLRPCEAGDQPEVRSLIHEGAESRPWTPERVSIDTPFPEGQKVRISIETASEGYLYVIDSTNTPTEARATLILSYLPDFKNE
jgi:hypothetical protein